MGVKQFDHPYLLTMGTNHVRYQILPAHLHNHRINLVYHYVKVNPAEELLKIWSGNFHCVDCKIMGNKDTLKRYNCR